MQFNQTDLGQRFDNVIEGLEDMQKRLDHMQNTLDIIEYALNAAVKLEENQVRIAALEARTWRPWKRG